jgi:UDP-3-O-[3-hydroxymyristoyl] N-acetylglucosamine deacetylase
VLCQNGERASVQELCVTRTDYGVRVEGAAGRLSVDLVEHLFAALAALHATHGVSCTVWGPELPLLDGGCGRWLDALRNIGLEPGTPRYRVQRGAIMELGQSVYEFEPFDGIAIEVEVDFGTGIGRQNAMYVGDVEQFRHEIAGARTFGFRRDRQRLQSSGRARGVDQSSVIIFDELGQQLPPAAPAAPGELARHKLLDLCGDLFLYGGIPLGRLKVRRPGHTASHAAFRRAQREGVVVPVA